MALRLKILCIEDDEDDFVLVQKLLSAVPKTKYELDWIRTYEAGLKALSRPDAGYDACLLDYQLGSKTGLDLLHEASAWGCRIPVLLLTGQGSYEVDLLALETGAADYLAKDQISTPLLDRSIRYAISHKRTEEQCRTAMQRYIDAEKALRTSEQRYRTLFDESPISLSEDDFSEIKNYLDQLKASGIRDLRAHFDSHPEEVRRCAGMVRFVHVNKITLDLYRAGSIEEFQNGLSLLFSEESYEGFKEALLALSEGTTRFEIDTVNQTLQGDKIHVTVRISAPPGCEENLSRVFVSVVDITERKKVEAALRESERQLKHLSSELLKAQEKERKRIANVIHDSIGQTLHAIRVGLGRVGRQSKTGADCADAEPVDDLVHAVDFAIDEVRSIYMDLRPSLLDDLGFLAAMRWFLREFQETHGHILVEEQIDISEEEIPDHLKIIFFRILQAAMDNIARHSGAETARLSLKRISGSIEMIVEDNGNGFNLKDSSPAESGAGALGLATMQERVESACGIFNITSVIGTGTRIRSLLPADENDCSHDGAYESLYWKR